MNNDAKKTAKPPSAAISVSNGSNTFWVAIRDACIGSGSGARS